MPPLMLGNGRYTLVRARDRMTSTPQQLQKLDLLLNQFEFSTSVGDLGVTLVSSFVGLLSEHSILFYSHIYIRRHSQ